MKNTVKRMLSGLMAMAMVMCGTTAVYAAELKPVGTDEVDGSAVAEIDGNQITSENTKKDLPDINVTVPSSIGDIVINPFNLGGAGQIYSADLKVVNNSEVPVTVMFTSAAVTLSESITVATKTPSTTGAKSAMVNLTYTDGLGKTASKALTAKGQDITVATPMAPLGGSVTYTFTGATTVNPTKTENKITTTDPWGDTDTISVAHAFKFTASTYAEYNFTKTLALYASDAAKTFVKGDVLPSSILADGKELPVAWKANTDGGADYDPSSSSAGEYIAYIPDENAAIYSTSLGFPKITVAEAPVEETP